MFNCIASVMKTKAFNAQVIEMIKTSHGEQNLGFEAIIRNRGGLCSL